MSWIRFIQLFRMIFGPAARIDTRRIESMGLLAVKIAQMYAIRGDLLASASIAKLQCLYEQATPMSGREFLSLLQQHASPALLAALGHVESEPLAVASLGQVHRASLNDGRQIVIKILRRQHAAAFARDIRSLRLLIRCALLFYPKLKRLADPLNTLASIEHHTMAEMNLLAEFEGTAKLAAIRDEAAPRLPHLLHLKFPHIDQTLSNDAVLVSEFIAAPTVRALLEQERFSYSDLLLLFRIHGYFLFGIGRFHGDFHPGNLFFDGTDFTWIDNANVETADPAFTRGLLEFMVHLGHGRIDDAAAAIEKLSLKPLTQPLNFRREFSQLYQDFGAAPIGELSLTKQMMKTIRLAVDHGLIFPEGAFPIIKSLMYLDGMAIRCAPEKRLLDDVALFASDLLGDAVHPLPPPSSPISSMRPS